MCVQNAERQLETLEKDLRYLKDQITTTEVNVARVHNYGVELRKALRAAGAKTSETAVTKT